MSITIPVELYYSKNRRILETGMLIDSGATICAIDLHLVQRMKWPMERLQVLLYTRNIDRMTNSGGLIQHQVTLHLQIDRRNMVQKFFILNLGKMDNIILGYPWLAKHNPRIDWMAGEIRMLGTPIPCHIEPEVVKQWYLLHFIKAVEEDRYELALWIYAQQRNQATLQQVLGERHLYI